MCVVDGVALGAPRRSVLEALVFSQSALAGTSTRPRPSATADWASRPSDGGLPALPSNFGCSAMAPVVQTQGADVQVEPSSQHEEGERMRRATKGGESSQCAPDGPSR